MTELRQKMIRTMELKNLSDHTQRAYLAAVTGIAKFYNQSPDKMTREEIEDYLLYLKQDKGICYLPQYREGMGSGDLHAKVTDDIRVARFAR